MIITSLFGKLREHKLEINTLVECSRRLTKPPLTSKVGDGSSYLWRFMCSLLGDGERLR